MQLSIKHFSIIRNSQMAGNYFSYYRC